MNLLPASKSDPLSLTAPRAATRRARGTLWYRQDVVQLLTDNAERELGRLTAERDRLKRERDYFADLAHARRHGTLPTTHPIIDIEAVDRTRRTQEQLDSHWAQATAAAAELLATARQQRQADTADAPTSDLDREHLVSLAEWLAELLATHTERVNASAARQTAEIASAAAAIRQAVGNLSHQSSG